MSSASPPAASKKPSPLRRLFPWLVALLLLVWLLNVTPVDKLLASLRSVPLPSFVAIVSAYVIGNWLTDSLASWVTFLRALPDTKISYGDILLIRGSSYLLGIIHYGAGQASITYFLAKNHGVAYARAAGAVMLTVGVNAVLMAGCVALALALGGAPDQPGLRTLVGLLGFGFFVYLAVICARPKLLAERSLLAPLFQAGLRGHLMVALFRLPHVSVLIVCHWLAMRQFGVAASFSQALALLPIVFVVGVLPISLAGLGTSQATAVALFSSLVVAPTLAEQRAVVLAYSLSLHFLALLLQVLLGVGSLRRLAHTARVLGEEKNSGP